MSNPFDHWKDASLYSTKDPALTVEDIENAFMRMRYGPLSDYEIFCIKNQLDPKDELTKILYE